MSKKRYFDTKFWSDSYVTKLDPTEKLLFIYLMTNERTNVAGVYELPIKLMSVESGIEISMLENILLRFVRDNKIVLFDGWVRVINSLKHQNLDNRNIVKGVENVYCSIPHNVKLGLELPQNVSEFIQNKGLGMSLEESYMSHIRPSNNLDLDLDLDLNLNTAPQNVSVVKKATKKVDPVSKAYYDVIRELKLPVSNHEHVKRRIKQLQQEIGQDEALKYLEWLQKNYMLLNDDGYKPILNNGLDIYAKRVNIKTWIERKILEQSTPVKVGGRPIL